MAAECTHGLTRPTWAEVIAARPRLTAKALRALGLPVPSNVPDDECVVLITKES
jgi:hypothetical protein